MATQRRNSTVGSIPAVVETKFETVLPRLVCAYEQGHLVPFVGAGMSTPACRLWGPFVDQLEKQAELESAAKDNEPDRLVMRANRAIGRLRALGTDVLAEKIRKALFDENPNRPPQTEALCRLFWPMVLTTNYDDCLFTAFECPKDGQPRRDIRICGRKPDDAQYVLNALYEPAEAILWALQGYLGGPFKEPSNEFAEEIVVGHEEYRKVAHAEPHFRRAFAEVFRSRSMLFIGSGLREHYFREMFSEILEIYGPCSQPHYAFVKEGELDPELMATQFQTFVIEYKDHSTVEQWLNDLATAVEGSGFRQDSVSFACRPAKIDDPRITCSRLSVIQGPLPEPAGSEECLALSAGGEGSAFFFSRSIESLKQRVGVKEYSIPERCSTFVSRFEGHSIFAVRAREKGNERALRVVRDASMQLFDTAWQHGFRRILMQILAAGSEDAPRSGRHRPFSATSSLVESVRAFGQWCRNDRDQKLEVAMYVPDRSVYLEITSRRLDLGDLLSSRNLRFWYKVIYPGGKIRRQMCLAQEHETVGELADWLGLDLTHWEVESIPRVRTAEEAEVVHLSKILDEPLSWHIIPGGTLRFKTL
jgi:SIR2-like domain